MEISGFSDWMTLKKTLAKIPESSFSVLLAHEPDIFPVVLRRVTLTLAGHMHAGQVRFMGYAPVTPSKYGTRYLYGHIVEGGRHMIVSGGIGCSGAPVRFGAPPEIVVADLDAD